MTECITPPSIILLRPPNVGPAFGRQPPLASATQGTSASSSSSTAAAAWVSPRTDDQAVQPYGRGSNRLALHIASDPAALCSATSELKDRLFAKSNSHSVEMKLGTWTSVAQAVGFEDPFSLDPDMIYKVGVALWRAGYRTLDSYLAVARQEMTLKNRAIPESLVLHFKRVSRAAARGRGPCKQASAVPFLRLQDLPNAPTPFSHLGPCHPGRFAVISAWCMLRETQANNLTIDCITLKNSAAHVLLPASKTDPTGKGTSRTWCCTCSSTRPFLCPCHVLELQRRWASSLASPCPTSVCFLQFPDYQHLRNVWWSPFATSPSTLAWQGRQNQGLPDLQAILSE